MQYVAKIHTVFVKAAIVLVVGTLFGQITVHAQNCSVQLTNAAGDTISVTATLVTTDPNENGEGEPLQVISSGGEINATVSAYSVPTPFSYTAAAANETISGTIIGFDGDEGCSIGATVNGAHTFSPKTKSAANIAATIGGVTAVIIGGVAAGLGCTFSAGALCVALILGGVGGGLTWAVGGGIAGDPSDPNFMVIATPNIATIPPLSASGQLTQAEADAFNALFANEATIVGVGTAAITSANRAQGAHDAHDSFWEAQQIAAVQTYSNQLSGLFASQVDLLKNVRDALIAGGIVVDVTPSMAFSFEAQVAFSQILPPSYLQAINEFTTDQGLINQVRQLLIVQDINAAAGSFPTTIIPPQLETALKNLASALSSAIPVQIEIKPGSTAPVPINPKANGLIPVAVLSSATFDATKVDPASVAFGPNNAKNSLPASLEDVDKDGNLDMVLHFPSEQTGIACGATVAGLTGSTVDNVFFSGTEAITTVGCK